MKNGKFEYEITRVGATRVLVMNTAVTDLVINALEIISPEDNTASTVAEKIASRLGIA